MTEETWLNPRAEPSDKEVAFDYIKAHDFKVIWADGVVGSLTPNGLVHFALFAERQAIPRRQVFTIDQLNERTGKLGSELIEKRISRGSIVREMACDVFLSPRTAESLARWLLDRVAELQQTEGAENEIGINDTFIE